MTPCVASGGGKKGHRIMLLHETQFGRPWARVDPVASVERLLKKVSGRTAGKVVPKGRPDREVALHAASVAASV